jgi:cyclohexanone monooxygenase
LGAGWQRERIDNFNRILSGQPQSEDLVDDGWTFFLSDIVALYQSGRAGDRPLEAVIELANYEAMERLRRRVDEEVRDPSVAEALKPYYRLFCKRPCFHDDYLATFNRDHVTLVDTDGRGVDRVSERGVVAGGASTNSTCSFTRPASRLAPRTNSEVVSAFGAVTA